MFFKRNKEFLEILFYLIISIILVYYIPAPLNKLIFLGILPLIWRTKKDYLWLAFFFVIEDIPGGLFSGASANDIYRLPLYTITRGISFSIRELYLLLLLVKVLIKTEYKQSLQKNYFSKELSLAGYYLIFLLLISSLLGMTFEGYRNYYKMCINLTLFVSVPMIFRNREYLINFLNIIFPFAIIAILLQVYSLTFGRQLIAVFSPGVLITQGVLFGSGSTEEWQRPIEMIQVLIVCFTGSLFLLNKGNTFFKPGYLIIINLLSFLGIFLTGTRSWFLALIAVYIYFIITRVNQVSFKMIRNVFIAAMFIISINLLPVVHNQIFNAWNRLETLEKVAEGDITAGGTASRFNVRAPKVMEGFMSSTILAGAGFSNLYYQYQDGHVGYHNMLLNVGIIGMILFVVIILKAILLPYQLSKSKFLSTQTKQELKASNLLLIALLVINTGTQTLGYTPDGDNRFLLIVLALTFINQAMNFAIKSIKQTINVTSN
ncbi:MAG: hypothetical protein ABSA76_02460 [Bacteroidales bacterium]